MEGRGKVASELQIIKLSGDRPIAWINNNRCILKRFLGTPRTEFGNPSLPCQFLLFSCCVTVIAHLRISPPSAMQGEHTHALMCSWKGQIRQT